MEKTKEPRFEIGESGKQFLKHNSEVRIHDKENKDYLIIIEGGGGNFPSLESYAEKVLAILNQGKVNWNDHDLQKPMDI